MGVCPKGIGKKFKSPADADCLRCDGHSEVVREDEETTTSVSKIQPVEFLSVFFRLEWTPPCSYRSREV